MTPLAAKALTPAAAQPGMGCVVEASGDGRRCCPCVVRVARRHQPRQWILVPSLLGCTVDAADALLLGIVRLSAEIRFGAPIAWRAVTLHVNAAIHGVL